MEGWGGRFRHGGGEGNGGMEEAGGAERGVKGTARTEWEVVGVRMVGRRRVEAWKRRLSGILHDELRWPDT